MVWIKERNAGAQRGRSTVSFAEKPGRNRSGMHVMKKSAGGLG